MITSVKYYTLEKTHNMFWWESTSSPNTIINCPFFREKIRGKGRIENLKSTHELAWRFRKLMLSEIEDLFLKIW